ncbi:MAG: hypothetical protein ACKPE3_05145 [Sphaerospermopsis kisseleviana]
MIAKYLIIYYSYAAISLIALLNPKSDRTFQAPNPKERSPHPKYPMIKSRKLKTIHQ